MRRGLSRFPGFPNILVDVNSHNAQEEVEEMCGAILRGTPARHEGVEGVKTVITCSAAITSMKTGLPVKPDYRAVK